jgi:DNA-binding transcriptional MerR regulator
MPMMSTSLAKIGEVAARYGISSRALRYYEEVGILTSVIFES